MWLHNRDPPLPPTPPLPGLPAPTKLAPAPAPPPPTGGDLGPPGLRGGDRGKSSGEVERKEGASWPAEEVLPAVVRARTSRARVPWLRQRRMLSPRSLPPRFTALRAAAPPPPVVVGDTHTTPFSYGRAYMLHSVLCLTHSYTSILYVCVSLLFVATRTHTLA